MSVGSLSISTVIVRRRTEATDGGAASLKVVGVYRARVQPGKGNESVLYGRDTEVLPVTVYIEGRADVRTNDVIGLQDGKSLLVRSASDVNLAGVFTAVVCEFQS